MKVILTKIGIYASFLFWGLCMSILFILISYPIEMAFTLSPIAERIIKTILGELGVILTLFLLSYKEGYRNRHFNLKVTIIACIFVFIIQQILAPLLTYAAYVSGTGSLFLADLFYLKNKLGFYTLVPPIIKHICMTASYIFLVVPAFLCGELLGVKKRKKEIKILTRKENLL